MFPRRKEQKKYLIDGRVTRKAFSNKNYKLSCFNCFLTIQHPKFSVLAHFHQRMGSEIPEDFPLDASPGPAVRRRRVTVCRRQPERLIQNAVVSLVGGALQGFTGICLQLQPLGQIRRWGELRSHRVSHVGVGRASLRLPAVSVPTGGSHLRSFTDLHTLKAGPIVVAVLFYYNSRRVWCI